ncbi:E6 protein [Tree shrew papillomavirus 1]|uniref:Protein E6 n=1 Tax=Tree shrew papillomavirus 1 TaxID=2562515 RepID=A0AAF1D2G5_9PAPI|nr:E6 protein [Tree shrew papillomavirus 1]
MASPGDKTLRDLCRDRRCKLQDLRISCVFCKGPLCLYDLHNFDISDLVCSLKNGVYYAACERCIRVVCQQEFCNFLEATYYPEDILNFFGIPLFWLKLRCPWCCRKLCLLEIAYVLQNHSRVYKVKGQFKSECLLCAVL